METKVIKLGGSMISKDVQTLFDEKYILDLKAVLMRINAVDESKFFLACGGGVIMRKYRDALTRAGITNETDIHWVGITVNVVNAMVVKAIFEGICDEDVLKFEEYYSDEPLIINNIARVGGGGRPGHSGDVDALVAAKRLGATKVYSIKNVDGVYTADPRKDPSAKLVNELSWPQYLDIIGNPIKHMPGANFPIDPIASKMAEDAGIKFIIIGGNLINLENTLSGKPFIGSTVG